MADRRSNGDLPRRGLPVCVAFRERVSLADQTAPNSVGRICADVHRKVIRMEEVCALRPEGGPWSSREEEDL
jgi:hypothetical protein